MKSIYKNEQETGNCNLERNIWIMQKQKRRDWDHKAYHNAPSDVYCAVTQ